MKETLTRTATGILFTGILLAMVLFNAYTFLSLFSLILLLAWFELRRLLPPVPPWIHWPVMSVLIIGFVLIYLVLSDFLSKWWLFIILLVPLMTLFCDLNRWKPGRNLLWSGAVLYLLGGLSAFHLLAFQLGETNHYVPRLILILLILLWTNDTMAYTVGRLAGKHPIWPRVSPSKTWEGLAGGWIFSLIAALILHHFYGMWDLLAWAGLATVIVLGGTAGDFIESVLKRRAGIKDSGRLLPGHGGILDRFDSALLAAPLTCLYLYLLI